MKPEVAELYANALPVKSAEELEAEAAAERLRQQAIPVSQLLADHSDLPSQGKHVFFLSLLLLVFVVYLGFEGGDWVAHWLLQKGSDRTSAVKSKSTLEGGSRNFAFVDEEDVPLIEVDFALVLRNYYTKFNPNRLADVPNILDRYNGRETELFAKLKDKYGVNPMTPKFGYRSTGDISSDESGENEGGDEEEDGDEDEEGSLIEGEEEEEEHMRSIKQHVAKGEDFIQKQIEAIKHQVGEQAERDSKADASESNVEEALEEFVVEEEDEQVAVPNDGHDAKVEVICVGLMYTGLSEISGFLSTSLGIQATNDASTKLERVILGSGPAEFNVFDHDPALVGLAISAFFLELLATYPSAKVIISVRDVDSWFEAVKANGPIEAGLNGCGGICSDGINQALLMYLFGTAQPAEYWWKRRYIEFYSRVLNSVPRSRRKLVDLYSKDTAAKFPAWEWIAYFLGKSKPSTNTLKLPLQTSTLRTQLSLPTGPDPMARLPVASTIAATTSGQLKVIAAGLDHTGEAALSSALKKLGFKVLSGEDVCKASHKSCGRHSSSTCTYAEKLRGLLSKPQVVSTEFGFNGIFQGVDAVVGAPAALFWEMLRSVNPDAKLILTVREGSKWLKSMKSSVSAIVPNA